MRKRAIFCLFTILQSGYQSSALEHSCKSLLREQAHQSILHTRDLEPIVYNALRRLTNTFNLVLADAPSEHETTQILSYSNPYTLIVGKDLFTAPTTQSLKTIAKIRSELKFLRKIHSFGLNLEPDGTLIPLTEATPLTKKIANLKRLYGITVSINKSLFQELPTRAIGVYDEKNNVFGIKADLSMWNKMHATSLEEAILTTIRHEQIHAISWSKNDEFFLGRSMILVPDEWFFPGIDAYGSGFPSDEVDAFLYQNRYTQGVQTKIQKRIRKRIEALINIQIEWLERAISKPLFYITIDEASSAVFIESDTKQSVILYFRSGSLSPEAIHSIITKRLNTLRRKINFLQNI